jgi:hypothetical protein
MLNDEQNDKLKSYGTVDISNLEILDAMYIYKIDTGLTELSEVFNNIVPSYDISFASWNSFSKIQRNSKLISKNWVNEDNNIIYLKYTKWQNIYTIPSSYLEDDYIEEEDEDPPFGTIFIQKNEDLGLIAVFQYYDTRKSISLKELEKRVVKCLNCKKITSGSKQDVRGRFNVPSQMLQQYVLLHLITNNDIFSELIRVDEQKQTKKSHLTLQYIHNISSYKKPFTFTITQQQNNENGTYYVRINIKGSHQIDVIEDFKLTISKLLSMYNSLENEVIVFYKQYDIKPDPRPKIKKIKKQKSAISNHSRECGHKPMVFNTEEEALQYTKGDKSKYILFPKEGDVTILDDKGDILTSKYYACDDKDRWKFPGLTKNLIPCCYEINQNTKTRTLYKYENSIPLTDNRDLTNHILLGYKPLLKGQQGYLPESLDEIFTFFIKEPQQYYKRDCIDNSKNSFIKCISTALNIGYSDVLSFMDNTPELAKQELYDHSVEEIRNYINDENRYKDPRHFSVILEELFNLVIIVLDNKGIIKPNYTKNYYRRIKKKEGLRYIFIYEQQDECMFNICNLITYVDGKDFKFIFDKTEDICVFFEKKIQEQCINIDFDIHPNWILLSQSVDTYGKTRIIDLQHKSTSKNITLQTSPLQPFPVKITNINTIKPLQLSKEDFQIVTDFTNDYNIKSKKNEYIDFEMSEFILINYSNIEFRLPFLSSYKVFEKKIDPAVSIPLQNNQLENYVKCKRIAYCIMQYSLWLLAKQPEINIEKFIKENTILIPSYNYSNIISSKLSTKDNPLFNDNKIILNSYNLRRNLQYYLQHTLKRQPTYLNRYKTITHIEDFYKRKDDFDMSSRYFILKDITDIEKLIK